MEVCSKDKLMQDIRIALDENMSSEALAALPDVDTLSHDDIIASKIEDAALAVVMAAPVEKLSDVSESLTGTLSISAGERHIGTMQLPTNFVRLVRFKLSSWSHAIFKALQPSTSLYEQAHSEFNVFGTKERPVVFLVPETSGMKLECFCASSIHDTLDGCLYVRRPKMVDSNISIGEHLYRPTVYYAAYLTALEIKDADAAAALQATAKEMLGVEQ